MCVSDRLHMQNIIDTRISDCSYHLVSARAPQQTISQFTVATIAPSAVD